MANGIGGMAFTPPAGAAPGMAFTPPPTGTARGSGTSPSLLFQQSTPLSLQPAESSNAANAAFQAQNAARADAAQAQFTANQASLSAGGSSGGGTAFIPPPPTGTARGSGASPSLLSQPSTALSLQPAESSNAANAAFQAQNAARAYAAQVQFTANQARLNAATGPLFAGPLLPGYGAAPPVATPERGGPGAGAVLAAAGAGAAAGVRGALVPAGVLAAADGPAPFGDAAAGIVLGAAAVGGAIYGTYQILSGGGRSGAGPAPATADAAPALPNPDPGLTPALPSGFGPLPGLVAAPPFGALPGFNPIGETPALPGFEAVDPTLTGPQIAANQSATPQAVRDAITAALGSTNPGTRLEGQVGQAIVAAGIPVIGFGSRVLDASGDPVGEIDVETPGAIIEVTTRRGQKLEQIGRYIGNPALNPQMKPVILYAPRYGGFAAADIERAGATVVRNLPDLIATLNMLGAK